MEKNIKFNLTETAEDGNTQSIELIFDDSGAAEAVGASVIGASMLDGYFALNWEGVAVYFAKFNGEIWEGEFSRSSDGKNQTKGTFTLINA